MLTGKCFTRGFPKDSWIGLPSLNFINIVLQENTNNAHGLCQFPLIKCPAHAATRNTVGKEEKRSYSTKPWLQNQRLSRALRVETHHRVPLVGMGKSNYCMSWGGGLPLYLSATLALSDTFSLQLCPNSGFSSSLFSISKLHPEPLAPSSVLAPSHRCPFCAVDAPGDR